MMSGYRVPFLVETKPNQMAVWRHGCSQKWLVVFMRLCFSSVNSFSWSVCGHSRKCHRSSFSCWHEGHNVNPLWGCALDVHSGSLSLINRRMRHWSPSGNVAIADCRVGQLTLLRSCCVQVSFSLRYL